jgi:hypothetical protein
MGKVAIKRAKGITKNFPLVDTDRINPKANGGTYAPDNVRVLAPREHMARHGTLRDREAQLAELKAVFDDRVQTMKLLLKIQNQQLAYERRTDDQHAATSSFLKDQRVNCLTRLGEIDADLRKRMKAYGKVDALTARVLAVRGVGPITAAALAVYIDLAKAASASSLWAYVGYDKPSHARYAKGVAGGGNKTLRTVLYNTVTSMWKDRKSAYRLVGERVKARLAVSEKVTNSRNTQGKLVEVAWKDAKPCHRQGAAMRAMAKHFLADYWFVGREMAGMPTRSLYAEGMLGHTGIIAPEERGW